MRTIDATAAQAWCLVRIATRPFAVALHAVAEIIEAEALVRLALCSPRVLGLCTYRRDLLPVIALDEGSSTPRPADHAEGREVILILRGEHGAWGIRIDRGGAVVAEGTLDPRATTPEGAGGAVVAGSVTRDGTTYPVIDTEATWRSVRDAIELWYGGDLGRDRRRGA